MFLTKKRLLKILNKLQEKNAVYSLEQTRLANRAMRQRNYAAERVHKDNSIYFSGKVILAKELEEIILKLF